MYMFMWVLVYVFEYLFLGIFVFVSDLYEYVLVYVYARRSVSRECGQEQVDKPFWFYHLHKGDARTTDCRMHRVANTYTFIFTHIHRHFPTHTKYKHKYFTHIQTHWHKNTLRYTWTDIQTCLHVLKSYFHVHLHFHEPRNTHIHTYWHTHIQTCVHILEIFVHVHLYKTYVKAQKYAYIHVENDQKYKAAFTQIQISKNHIFTNLQVNR